MTTVWIKLYIGDVPERKLCKLNNVPRTADIYDTMTLVKENNKNSLDHCDARNLEVFPPNTSTEQSFSEQTSIREDTKLKDLIDELKEKTPPVSIDYDHPLIVVAPAPPQQQSRQQHQQQQQV